jgi:uncharacterized membrane protein (UPF0127 family)
LLCYLLPAIFIFFACRPSVKDDGRRLPLPVAQLTVNDRTVYAELARLPHERSRGLMFRRTLAPDSGMLFIFDAAERQRFWMKNTLIPLSIAFADTAGAITDILEMTALDTATDYSASVPARYALEMNRGWFAANAVRPGDTIRGLPDR